MVYNILSSPQRQPRPPAGNPGTSILEKSLGQKLVRQEGPTRKASAISWAPKIGESGLWAHTKPKGLQTSPLMHRSEEVTLSVGAYSSSQITNFGNGRASMIGHLLFESLKAIINSKGLLLKYLSQSNSVFYFLFSCILNALHFLRVRLSLT